MKNGQYVGFEGAGESKMAMNFRMKNMPSKMLGVGGGVGCPVRWHRSMSQKVHTCVNR